MKEILLKIASPILNRLEVADDGSEYNYSPSHRKILWVMGMLFIGIACVGFYFAMQLSQIAALFPVVLFTSIGLLCLIVAGLGSDRAVAKLWRNRD
ncbi:MAG: hypothetical protein ISEC1_P0577 [Thiomicrorhabdus sp.]|nr:MAG: hypothetical protein ISEC1_P0577 [Thiomicrorhabdus sp.]